MLCCAVEWAMCILASIFKGKSCIRNCSCNGDVKHPEHGIMVVKRLLQNRFPILVTVN